MENINNPLHEKTTTEKTIPEKNTEERTGTEVRLQFALWRNCRSAVS